MKMLHDCRATHVLWAIWDDGGIHFWVRPEERSIQGQTRSKEVKLSKSKFSSKSIPILSSFVSGFQNCYLYLRTTIRNAQNCISKSEVITFTYTFCFWPLHSQ